MMVFIKSYMNYNYTQLTKLSIFVIILIEGENMIEGILNIAIMVIIGIPLVLYAKKLKEGEMKVKKWELFFSFFIIIGCVALWMVRVVLGSESVIGLFEFVFFLIALLNIKTYMTQKGKQDG